MRPPCRPPVCTDELLHQLRRARLLDKEQVARLRAAWDGSDPPAPHVQELVRAGLLTQFQAERVMNGRARSLRVGPYRLLDRLGRGGMGQVYRAEHVLLRRVVALKVLGRLRRRGARVKARATPQGSRTPRVHSRRPTQLRREIELTGRLSHPNIVTAHDACRLGNRFVLVLEYVDGVDLERLLNETGPLPVVLAVEVLRQSALALAHLHEQKLVHRDVKPANLLLTHTPGKEHRPVVKLLDLGLACPAALAGDELCGTPDYLAPERGQSPDSTDIRSDLYSLGCTLYQLLSGQVPFPGGVWTDKLLRHRLEVPVGLKALRPDLPVELIAVVERLMARDPNERFATPMDLLAAIEGLPRLGKAVPPPAVPRPVPAAVPVRPRLRMSRQAIFGCMCVIAMCLGAGAGSIARRSLAATIPNESEALRDWSDGPTARPRHPDLVEAIETAANGAVVEVPAGRHILPPIQIHGRRLTLRASPGAKPILIRAPHKTWDPLIHSDSDLTLEGLELQGGELSGIPVPLVVVEQGQLAMRRCEVTQRCPAPALSVRQGAAVLLDRVGVTALGQGVSVELGGTVPCRVELRDCRLHVRETNGAALLLWANEFATVAPVKLQVKESRLRAGRLVVCRSVNAPVTIETQASHLIFLQSLLSLDVYPREDRWQDRITWRGEGNRYEASGSWVQRDGRAVPARDEQAFAMLWREAK